MYTSVRLQGRTEGKAASRRFIYYFGADEKFITERRTRLKHFHVHDSANGKCHLPLGEGAADWRKYLAAAENLDCRAVIETKTVAGLEASVYVLRKENFIK